MIQIACYFVCSNFIIRNGNIFENRVLDQKMKHWHSEIPRVLPTSNYRGKIPPMKSSLEKKKEKS